MAGSAVHLLVVLLVFSHLVSSDAVPMSRTRNLLHGTPVTLAYEKINQITKEEVDEEEMINGRMDLEKNDYPGPGANRRHTPIPPVLER